MENTDCSVPIMFFSLAICLDGILKQCYLIAKYLKPRSPETFFFKKLALEKLILHSYLAAGDTIF